MEKAAAAERGRKDGVVGGHWPSLRAYKSESQDDCKRQERQEKVSERTMTTMARDVERLTWTKKKKKSLRARAEGQALCEVEGM